MNTEKGNDETICTDYLAVKPLLVSETIPNQINQFTKHKALEIMPFGNDAYTGFGEMIERIKDEASRPGKKQKFRRRFDKHFGNFYTLYSAKEVKDSKLFGDGPENVLFESMLGDFLAIAKTDVSITAPGDHFHVSHHAGYTDDELLIPCIAKFLP